MEPRKKSRPFLSTGARVIMVTGCNKALVVRVSEAFSGNIRHLFRVLTRP